MLVLCFELLEPLQPLQPLQPLKVCWQDLARGQLNQLGCPLTTWESASTDCPREACSRECLWRVDEPLAV
jgi:hypothetical protein